MKYRYKNTATTIHHYNQFLSILDKKTKHRIVSPSTPSELDTELELYKNICFDFDLEKEKDIEHSLEKIIRKLEELFSDYDSPSFHGSYSSSSTEETKIQLERTPSIREKKKKKEPTIEKKKVTIDIEVKSIDDLLKLIQMYPIDDNTIEYNVHMKDLHKIKDCLTELNEMVGIQDVKNNIVDQILYFIQGLNMNSADFMHTVLYGPPGTGKTEIAKIIGKIYSKMGILKNGVFKKVTRSDLIAGYLGQTAIKTREVIKECLGGVLFIDEAYALGNSEKKDTFSKECIDTLCEALSDHKHELMVIIAGYEHELNECFFQYNQGLDSRFTWRFKTDSYNAKELHQIFLKKVRENGWTEGGGVTSSWFEGRIDSFPSYGRDMETLLSKTKIAHSRRVFCKPEAEKKKILLRDLEKGFEMYLKNENIQTKKEREQLKRTLTSMYL